MSFGRVEGVSALRCLISGSWEYLVEVTLAFSAPSLERECLGLDVPEVDGVILDTSN